MKTNEVLQFLSKFFRKSLRKVLLNRPQLIDWKPDSGSSSVFNHRNGHIGELIADEAISDPGGVATQPETSSHR